MIIDKATAISSLVEGAEYVLNNDTGEVLWINPTSSPVTDEQIDAELVRLQTKAISDKKSAIAAKESALSKLTALGLTADEVKALLGAK
jgi:hypothetical protein